MSFTSTLYLYPILDVLLADIPDPIKPEIRLGLQEALVNAAKHGNQLDPQKTIVVQFCVTKESYSWIISDEGKGFAPRCSCDSQWEHYLPEDDSESGRGLCLLYEIFDQVHWNDHGSQLKLCKQIRKH